MRSSPLFRAAWCKSGRSNDGGDGDCVEVARLADQVALRDSKDADGPVLAFSRAEWSVFLSDVRTDRFSRAVNRG